ncbi:hypothetical protein EV421DRAFT_1887642 [Armillaria borealis]|uniref:Uncharacterized protein n=1 Tax=Armillaria borealis TaxID=47425 RepID=A0AA39K525_9AGAR|nr:hypothetical protein EV421DRAFT_1887642 [Armillaria borealis]
MSSISFPSPSPSHDTDDDGQFYSSVYDTSASFTMNPLSSHPPRTPRTSVVSSSSHHHYGSSIYTEKAEEEQQEDGKLEVDIDYIWREMVLTSNGPRQGFRMKLIQYSIRMYLYFHKSFTGRLLRGGTRSPWEQGLVKRLESTVSGFSFSRKLLLLFNWLSPLTAIMAQNSTPVPFSASSSKVKPSRPLLHAILHAPPPVLLELVNAFADDMYALSLIGLLGKRTGERAGKFADWCWLLSTLVGLVENGVERQMIGGLQSEVESRLYKESMSGATAKSKPKISKIDEKELERLQKQDYWLQITRAKLAMDLIFVSYDLFHFKRGREPVKTFTGLMAAILSSAKLFDRHKNSLAKALSVTL